MVKDSAYNDNDEVDKRGPVSKYEILKASRVAFSFQSNQLDESSYEIIIVGSFI